MARRGQHSLEQIKDMVLVASEDIVVNHGLNKLTVRNIAAKIGYTVGSIYMVFSNMDDLILHINGRTLNELAETMETIQAKDSKQHLIELAWVYVRYTKEHRNRWRLIFGSGLDGATSPEWYQNKLDNVYGKFVNQFANLAPTLSSEQNRQLAFGFFGGIHGIITLRLTTHICAIKDNDFEQSLNFFINRYIAGIADDSSDGLVSERVIALESVPQNGSPGNCRYVEQLGH